MTPLDAALAYATEQCWRVVPIPAGGKRPRLSAWQDAATTDPDLIEQWWQQWPGDGIGIACGAVSGLFVVDVDVSDGKPGLSTLAELEATHGELPETYTVRTGSGGWHYYFRWDPARPIRNGKLGDAIDIRGEGGQVLAPPTIHPTTGEAYIVHLDVPMADAPDWVYDILLPAKSPDPLADTTGQTVQATIPKRESGPTHIGTGGDDGPAQRYNDAQTWDQLLSADGWTLHHVDHAGESHWTRPGKDKRDGTSATTNYQGRDCLVVFTSSVPGLDAEVAYSRFGYYAATRHNGDRSAAARQLLDDGYKPDLMGWAEHEARRIVPANVDADTGEVIDDGEWEEPMALGMAPQQLPTFPVEVFPGWLADQVQAVADDIQVPIDLPATIALAALAAVAARQIEISADSWVTRGNLYLVVASPPGQGKSPVFSAMTSCLERLQASLAMSLAPDVAKAELSKRIAEKQARKAEEKGDVDEAWVHHQQAMSVDVPKPPRLIADDATPEALTKLLADNGGRMAIMSSEGGVFDLMTGRYSDSSNMEVYLKAWSYDSIYVDRIGREPEHVEHATLTIGLTVQPMVIQRLANKPELAGRGLTSRFMYSLPPSNVGRRDMTKRRADRSAQQQVYDAKLTSLYHDLAAYQTPGRLSMSDADVDKFYAWRQSIELRRDEGGDLRPLSEWTSKLEQSVLSLCGLLHLAYGGRHHGPLDEGVVDLALIVADYWIEHAFAVHDLWGTDDTLAGARSILAWAHDDGVGTFTASEVHKKLRSRFDRIADVAEPLTLLVERGWVRPLFDGPMKLGVRGKGSPGFAVHPTARPVDNLHVSGPVVREWCTTTPENPKVVSHVHHVRKDLLGVTTTTHSGHVGGVPPAHDANEAQLADELDAGTYHALPEPTFDRSVIDEML
jgi:replicative DNA helicase